MLPSKSLINSYLGRLGDVESMSECLSVINKVFGNLNCVEKHCKILVDEIHIKPRV